MNKNENKKVGCHCEENFNSTKQSSTPVSNQCVNNRCTIGRKVEDCRVGVSHLLAMTRIGRSLEKIFKKIFRDDASFLFAEILGSCVASPRMTGKAAEILGSKLSFCPRMTREVAEILGSKLSFCPRMTFSVLTLATVLSFSIISDSWADGCPSGKDSCGENCCYVIDNNGQINFSRINENETGTIGEGLFAARGLTGSVTIPSWVTGIGEGAFAENQLTSVTIPDGVTNIGYAAFILNQLDSITIPKSVTNIGDAAFQWNSLSAINIQDAPVVIGSGAFSEIQSGSTTLNLGNAVVSIGSGAFGNGRIVGDITIPETVTEIGSEAFGGNNLTSIEVPNTTAVHYDSFIRSGVNPLVINDNFDGVIPDNAFNWYGLTGDVIIGNTITDIGAGAFLGYEGNNLTSVVIGDSVETIGEAAFGGNHNLTSVVIGDSVETIESAAFAECDLRSVIIPDSMTSIGDWAFAGNYNLTSVTLPEGLESIGAGIFGDCPNLSTITCVDKGKGGCDSIREQLREYGYEGEFKVDFIQPEWNQKHYTPAEAAKWLKDKDNTITITFKK